MATPGYRITFDDFAAITKREPNLEYYSFRKSLPPDYRPGSDFNSLEEVQWCYANCRGKFAGCVASNGPTLYLFFLNHYDAIHFRLRFDLDLYAHCK